MAVEFGSGVQERDPRSYNIGNNGCRGNGRGGLRRSIDQEEEKPRMETVEASNVQWESQSQQQKKLRSKPLYQKLPEKATF